AFGRLRRDLGAVQEGPGRERAATRPVGLAHSPPVGPEPPDVRGPGAAVLLSGEKGRPPKHGMLGAEPQQPPGELEEAFRALAELPVDPRQLVVLAVGVVVALLRPPDLV